MEPQPQIAGMILFVIGITQLCGFAMLDALIRFRMKRIGKKWVFLRGGTFDYGDYLRVASVQRWSAWPVYLMSLLLVSGVLCVIFAFCRYAFPPR
jgi:hypothetical protein